MLGREGLYKNDSEAERQAKMYSIVHWGEGTPTHDGLYLVTVVDASNTRFVTTFYRNGYYWTTPDNRRMDKWKVIAWCRLLDIKTCNIELTEEK